ncbi:Centrosomal protein [Amphibalanus amphitrite]|uniref:Centrosomal protein n=1 Tax=Amphibalanus amphitrite TaxID=1232801 RepID=A0A6A4WUL5_AMPAM|nr:Centrosomal protein [Amphibalanus amphitrite]
MLTELTADTEEEEQERGYGSEPEEEEEDSQLTEEPTVDSPEETQGESEPDSQTPWEADESPEEEEDGQEDTEGEEEDAGGHGDVSRQLSEEMELMRGAASSPEPAPPPVQRASATQQQQRSVSTFRRASRDTDSTDGMRRAAADADRPSRRELSAPARRPSSSDRRRRRRSDDFSSASEPGMGRRSGARVPTRNVETIAEIRETDAERAITETTREQAGDQLHKETVRREVRRKVSSAPATRSRQMSYTKQATRRSVCSDGVTDWLESQADDTRLHVDGKEADVFEYLRREFPYVHVSAETKRRLLAQYRHQMKYIMSLVEPVESRKIKIRRQDVLKRQALMTDIMRQQKAHDDRFKKLSDGKRREAKIRNMPRDSKISCLRAQRYVSSFQQQFQSRSAFNKSKEELLLRAVFEEMLEIQRSRLRAVRRLEKESIDEFYDANGYTADLNRVHQYYEANFRELAELLAKERSDLMRTQKQQKKLNDRIKREFREYMEADVRSLNDKIVNSWQPQFSLVACLHACVARRGTTPACGAAYQHGGRCRLYRYPACQAGGGGLQMSPAPGHYVEPELLSPLCPTDDLCSPLCPPTGRILNGHPIPESTDVWTGGDIWTHVWKRLADGQCRVKLAAAGTPSGQLTINLATAASTANSTLMFIASYDYSIIYPVGALEDSVTSIVGLQADRQVTPLEVSWCDGQLTLSVAGEQVASLSRAVPTLPYLLLQSVGPALWRLGPELTDPWLVQPDGWSQQRGYTLAPVSAIWRRFPESTSASVLFRCSSDTACHVFFRESFDNAFQAVVRLAPGRNSKVGLANETHAVWQEPWDADWADGSQPHRFRVEFNAGSLGIYSAAPTNGTMLRVREETLTTHPWSNRVPTSVQYVGLGSEFTSATFWVYEHDQQWGFEHGFTAGAGLFTAEELENASGAA